MKPVDGLRPEPLRQGELLVTRRLADADLVESVRGTPSVICGHTEIMRLVCLGGGCTGCGDALVVRPCQSVDHRAMGGCEVKVIAAEVLGWKLPVDRDDV